MSAIGLCCIASNIIMLNSHKKERYPFTFVLIISTIVPDFMPHSGKIPYFEIVRYRYGPKIPVRAY